MVLPALKSASLTRTDEENIRASLIYRFALAAAVISLIYALFHPYFSFHVPRWLFAILPVLLVGVLGLLRTNASALLPAHLIIFSFWSCFVVGTAYSGGVYSLVLPWLALMPIMAHLLIGHRAAWAWLAISAASMFFFFFFFKDARPALDAHGDWRSLFSYLGLVFVTSFFTHLYHQAKSRLVNQIKAKNAELLEQREEILAQNDELMQQRNELAAQHQFIARQNELLTRQNQQIDSVNRQLQERVQEAFVRNETLERHWHTLLNLTKSRSVNFGDFEEALKDIVRTAASSLKTQRVSVWAYNKERQSIQCLVLFDAGANTFLVEEDLLLEDFPRYFEALLKKSVIPADDAATHTSTFEFKRLYLQPRHILSLLDTPYFIDGELGGVLCCEQTDAPRHWTPEDIIFAQALADIVSLAYRATQRRVYEKRIRQHRKEIVQMNRTLEARVRERTENLRLQNQKLSEYAFINSHLLRGPLSRLLGLINLIERSEQQDKDLIQHLKTSGTELDQVVHKINDAITQNTLTRDDLVNGNKSQ
jgi:GAF domain-containing protein